MSVNIQTLKDIRNYLNKELKSIYPEQELSAITNYIFKTHFGIDKLQLLSDSGKIIPSAAVNRIVEICIELKTGKPLQYILGETIFYDCIIKVNHETFIPRPETEELVDLIIRENKNFSGRIIDLGTGSGSIAIAVKKNLKEAEVYGLDISEGALAIASSNAILNSVKITFLKFDIFKADPGIIPQAGIIVSNPPYVLESEKQFMSRNVLDYEPHISLFVPDEDPLIYYRAIINLSNKILMPGGKVYLEINEKKGGEMYNLLKSAGYSEIEVIDDINRKNRFIKGRLNG